VSKEIDMDELKDEAKEKVETYDEKTVDKML
jgi:hypothetical protein